MQATAFVVPTGRVPLKNRLEAGSLHAQQCSRPGSWEEHQKLGRVGAREAGASDLGSDDFR